MVFFAHFPSFWMQGGCCDLCNMGTCYSSFPGFYSSFFIFQAYATCFNSSMHHNAIAFVYENYKASEIGQEKEAKDASTIINVKLYVVAIFFFFFFQSNPTLLCYILGHCYWSSFYFQLLDMYCTERKLIKNIMMCLLQHDLIKLAYSWRNARYYIFISQC